MNMMRSSKKKADLLLPIDARALDVMCSNCFNLVKVDKVDSHSLECALDANNVSNPVGQT